MPTLQVPLPIYAEGNNAFSRDLQVRWPELVGSSRLVGCKEILAIGTESIALSGGQSASRTLWPKSKSIVAVGNFVYGSSADN